jgi:hypothetical protein
VRPARRAALSLCLAFAALVGGGGAMPPPAAVPA